LKKEAKGTLLNVDVNVSLTGNKSKSILRDKRYIPGIKDPLVQWLKEYGTCYSGNTVSA
jgi:hypothetical protein